MNMKVVLFDRGILIPNLGLALISMAALIQLMSLNPMPSLAKEAADQFSIGVPLMVGTAFLPRLRDNEHVGVRKAIGFLNVFFILGGVISCLVGLSKCFKLVSPQAAEYFSGACIFMGGISVANYLYTSYLRKQRVLSKSDT